MKPELLQRTKSAVAAGAVALVVGALVVGLSSLMVPSRSLVRPGFDLTAGASSFSIAGAIYGSPRCSGASAPLQPGTERCLVLTVQNNLSVPIAVTRLSTSVTSSPVGCPASDFLLPTFSGSLSVSASGTASTSGLPISLLENGANQDACEGATISFAYNGTAQFTDSTSIVLTANPTSPSAGQATVLRATVTGTNATSDPSLPTGTVTFDSCPTAACTTSSVLGTGSVGAGGATTVTTSSLTPGVHYVQAVYGGEGNDYSSSTSPSLAVTISAPVSSGSTTGSGNSTSGSGISTKPALPIAFTGADIAGMFGVALILIGGGTIAVLAVRRKRKSVGVES